MDSDRHTLLIRTAWLYHKHGLTQSEVAERLGVSRSTVSRALDEALRVGIVEVNVTEALPEATRLADALRERYPLKRAVVGIRLEDQDPSEAAAAGMGPAIEQLVSQGALTIAAGWGRTLAAATRSTRPRVTSGVTVVDAVGHATAGVIAPAVIVTDMLAAALSARVVHLPSPGLVADQRMANSLFSSPSVADILDLARSADVILCSVGIVGPESLLVSEGFLTPLAMDELVSKGAVGEILGHYYDAEGKLIETNKLFPIGLSLDDLRRSGCVVAVAGGVVKVDALRGAIAGGIINLLVVDDSAAQALLTDPISVQPTTGASP